MDSLCLLMEKKYGAFLENMRNSIGSFWNLSGFLPGFKFMLLNRLFIIRKNYMDDDNMEKLWELCLPECCNSDDKKKFGFIQAQNYFEELGSNWDLKIMND